MLAAQLVLGRVGVIDVVGRVAKGHVRELAAEHPLDVGQHRRVAAQQTMVAQDPEVARPADRLLGRLGDLVLRLLARRLAIGDRQQPLQLRGVEADQVEVEALVPQPSQLFRQQRVVPARLQGELVVCDQVRALLRLGEMLEPDHRHLGEAQLARREQPAVAGQDAGVLVDQDRVGPAELDHRGRDLIDLPLAVRARVALVRAQAVDRPQLDPLGERDQPGALRCVGQLRTSCDRCDGRDRMPDPQQNPGMLASLLCLVVGPTIASPLVWASNQVVRGPAKVLDGDTLVVAGEHVRLLGLDAPEDGQILPSGRSGVAMWRRRWSGSLKPDHRPSVVPAGRLHRDQPDPTGQAGGQVLQRPRHRQRGLTRCRCRSSIISGGRRHPGHPG